MREAEGRQQLPTALAEGLLREGVAFVTAGKLLPFVIGGVWEECKPHAPETFKQPLVEAARSRGRTETGHKPSLQHMLTMSSRAVC